MQRKHRSLGDEETDDLARFPEPVKGWPQDMTPKAQVPEAKINKWKYSKLECFRTAEKNNKMKRQPRNGREHLHAIYQTRGEYPNYIRNS